MYTYTYNGIKYSLDVADDQIALRTRNARNLNNAVQSTLGKKVLEDFNLEADFKQSDVSVLKLKKKVPDKIAKRDEARAILKSEPELRFAGRVLVEANGTEPVLYTENLVIKFKSHISIEICEKIIATLNLKIKRTFPYSPNTYFVSAPEGTGLDIFQISENILALPEVEFCHPELIRRKAIKVIHSKQWHLQKTLIGSSTIDAHSNAANAHSITQGEGIVIAIIDDGVDIDHPEFSRAGKVVNGRDATLGTNDPRPKYSSEKHGTACAGVACADGIKASGVAPKARLMPIRHASDLGSVEEADAIYWAVERGADIISCSWGPVDGDWSVESDSTHFTSVPLPSITKAAIKYAVEQGRNGKGCPVFWAAGNGREDVMFDGYSSNPDVIAVAACNDSNMRSVYSDFGNAVWCCFPSNDFESDEPLSPAPKTSGIYTTDRIGSKGYSSSDYNSEFGGTSSATPGVAGIAALILAVNPNLTVIEVKQILKDSCEKIDTSGGKYDANGHSIYYGFGRPDALKAVQLAASLGVIATNGHNIKIISALVNPVGRKETGKETVTIKNAGTQIEHLQNWVIQDDNSRSQTLNISTLAPGQSSVIALTTLKLSNSGGTITIFSPNGLVVHRVQYSKNDAKTQGQQVQFH